MITIEEEKELTIAAQAGDQAASAKLIKAHMPMIRMAARRYGSRLEEEDAISHGVIGLLNAIPRFDINSGFRLNTYARHYVNESIRTAQLKAPLIRYSATGEVKAGLQAARDLAKEGSALTPEKVMAKAGINRTAAQNALGKFAHSRSQTYASINDVLDLADDRPSAEEAIDLDKKRKILAQALDCLNDRERDIFVKRTAANDEPQTLEDLAQVYGVSRERIRQIENRALEKVSRRLVDMGVYTARALAA